MFFDGSFLFKEFCKPLSKGTFLQNNNAIKSVVWEVFKGFSLWLPWQPEFFMEHNYLKEFKTGPPKAHFCEIC